MKREHTIPFVTVKVSKNRMANGPCATEAAKTLHRFDMRLNRLLKCFQLFIASGQGRHDIAFEVYFCGIMQWLTQGKLADQGCNTPVNNGIVFKYHKKRPSPHILIHTRHWLNFQVTTISK